MDLKSYYRGRRYASETLKYLPSALKCFPDFADDIVCARLMLQMETVLDQVCRLGLIHSESNTTSAPSSLPQMELST